MPSNHDPHQGQGDSRQQWQWQWQQLVLWRRLGSGSGWDAYQLQTAQTCGSCTNLWSTETLRMREREREACFGCWQTARSYVRPADPDKLSSKLYFTLRDIERERSESLRDATNISKIIKDHAKTPTTATTRVATTRAHFGLISETWQQQDQQQQEQQHVAVSGFRFRSWSVIVALKYRSPRKSRALIKIYIFKAHSFFARLSRLLFGTSGFFFFWFLLYVVCVLRVFSLFGSHWTDKSFR